MTGTPSTERPACRFWVMGNCRTHAMDQDFWCPSCRQNYSHLPQPSHLTKALTLAGGMCEKLRKEIGLPSSKRNPNLPPPIPEVSYGMLVSHLNGSEDKYLRYICAQVASGRGKIGFDLDGQMIFHFIPERKDCHDHLDLVLLEEVWVVMTAPKEITDPYHGRSSEGGDW